MPKPNFAPVSLHQVNFAGHSFEVADVDHHLSDIKLYYHPGIGRAPQTPREYGGMIGVTTQ